MDNNIIIYEMFLSGTGDGFSFVGFHGEGLCCSVVVYCCGAAFSGGDADLGGFSFFPCDIYYESASCAQSAD